MSTAVIEKATPASQTSQLDAINEKLDRLAQSVAALGEQVNYLKEQAEDSRRRQQMWDDLWNDLTPVVNDVYLVAEEQLEEMQQFVQLEDLIALLKRLVRNTRNINEMLDILESAHDFVKDAAPLTHDMMAEATDQLAMLEGKGYFGFMRQGAYIVDQVVTSFSEDDVKHLGDNIVLILNTVKALTQPQMMNLVNSLTVGFHEAEAEAEAGVLETGLFSLLKQMRDPEVRRGLAVTMAMLKRVSKQAPSRLPTNGHNN
ncbi:MAG: DUF1641 domain-containing protein [Caldilineaceae bacterium]|nr:DUF1641 domain-containing protein [Caldilineaceae bacterium]